MFGNTMAVFYQGEAARKAGVKVSKVFDWVKAAKLIVENEMTDAEAGLAEDWNWTGGPILRDGVPVDPADTMVYLHSIWATPTLNNDPCWVEMACEEAERGDTYWPREALVILAENRDISNWPKSLVAKLEAV